MRWQRGCGGGGGGVMMLVMAVSVRDIMVVMLVVRRWWRGGSHNDGGVVEMRMCGRSVVGVAWRWLVVSAAGGRIKDNGVEKFSVCG
ncbi:hypothetical protein Tco_1487298 [Tanacetum coccineum]